MDEGATEVSPLLHQADGDDAREEDEEVGGEDSLDEVRHLPTERERLALELGPEARRRRRGPESLPQDVELG